MNNATTQYRFAHRIDMSRPYVPADETDIRKTFEKAIAQQDAAKPVKKSNVARLRK